ncbi:MAG: LytR C-terminal domain-containing protein [bacterium]
MGEKPKGNNTQKQISGQWGKWIRLAGIVLGLLTLTLWGVKEYSESQVLGSKYRYNLAMASEMGEVVFVSFDPEEKQIFAIPYPADLEINSRSVGDYRVGSLYKLGEYADEGGEFVRRKMQGFMRVPVLGYLTVKGSEKDSVKMSLRKGLIRTLFYGGRESSMSRLDAGLLIWRMSEYAWKEVNNDELTRAGIIEKADDGLQYHPERLKQYLVLKVFDWVVGETNVTVTVINASGENGLGSDSSEFLRNMGFDVVAVRGGDDQEIKERSYLMIDEEKETKHQKILDLLGHLFHWTEIEVGSTAEYRSEIVVVLGKDAKELF